jgi:uncharacterized membrane protein
MPPTLGAVALLLLAADGTWHWPLGRSAWRWLALVAVAVGGWLVTAPFHLGFHPPFKGVGLVHAWTEPVELLMYGGCLLVAAFGAAFALVRGWLGDGEPGRVGAVAVFAAATVLAAVSGRPTLVLLAVPLLVLTLATIARGEETDRAAIALAALGVFLFTVPEVVFVRDPYGEQLHRMNTVFKAYIQGWILLAVAVPVLLKRAARGVWVRRALVVVTVVPAVAHLAGMGAGLFSGKDLGIDGLRWMAEGDRAVVRALREQPQGAVLVEAVGGAYTEYARFSAASGVPAVLGWGNHESVWRGNTVTAEVEERKARVRELYSCGDPQGVRDVAAELGADLVAVGSLERADFDAEALKAVIAAGEVEVAEGEAVLVRFTGRVESPARGAEGE